MSIGDLCDQGRCAQILRGIAESKMVGRVADRNGQMMLKVLTGVLVDLDVDADSERVRELLVKHIARQSGVAAIEGSVA